MAHGAVRTYFVGLGRDREGVWESGSRIKWNDDTANQDDAHGEDSGHFVSSPRLQPPETKNR